MERRHVAHYRDGRFNGMISPNLLRLATKEAARDIAARYAAAFKEARNYRAVEVDELGYLVWEDEKRG